MIFKELSVKYRTQKRPGEQPIINCPESVVDLMYKRCERSPRERMWVLHVGPKLRVRAVEEIGSGGISSVVVEPAQVFTGVLLCGITGFILVHNHPSGDPTPSDCDLALTKRLQKGAGILGLSFHDHIVIGDNRAYVSIITDSM